MLKVKNKSY